MKKCLRCGAFNDDEYKFCAECGSELNSDSTGVKESAMAVWTKVQNAIDSQRGEYGILVNLVLLAIALVLIGVAIHYFVLAHETLYTINGIAVSEAPKFRAIGWILLIVGLAVAIVDGANLYDKERK